MDENSINKKINGKKKCGFIISSFLKISKDETHAMMKLMLLLIERNAVSDGR
jgi:hypothetical protein